MTMLVAADDHPRIRASAICPLCDLSKPAAHVVCWPCYKLWNFRHGASTLIAAMLDEREQSLTCEKVTQ